MMYTDIMQAKVGVHYHVAIGPDEVRLYDVVDMIGPYYDLVIDDHDEAVSTAIKMVQSLIGFGDDEDDVSPDDLEEMIDSIKYPVIYGDEPLTYIEIDNSAHFITIAVCGGCVPSCLN